MSEQIKKILCSVAKKKFKSLASKKGISNEEFNKIAMYQYFISNQCSIKKAPKKENDSEAIKRLKKRLYGLN